MRVALFNPMGPDGMAYIREGRCEQRLSSFGYRMLPVSLPSIAASLRQSGHDVTIVDASVPGSSASTPSPADARALLSSDLIVVNMATPTVTADAATVDALADQTRAHITAIGVHVTAEPEGTLDACSLDSVVRGEPEITVTALADALAAGSSLDQVDGLTFKHGAGFRSSPDREFFSHLDDLPVPARDLVDEAAYYLPLPRRPYSLVVPARGCPHPCTYCTAHLYYGKKLRTRRVDRVVDEIAEIVDRGVVRDIVMWADCFTLDRRYVLDLCEELIARQVDCSWMCNSRVDSFDRELGLAMKDAGCSGIAFGVESGDQGMLDRMRKGTTIAQGYRALRAVREVGIPSLAHFILGVPGETPETIRRTIDYAKALDPDFAQFYYAIPMPGTELYQQATEQGALVTTDWSRFELNQAIVATDTLSLTQLKRWRMRAYAEFYLRPRTMRRMVGRLRQSSLHAVLDDTRTFLGEWVLGA